MEMLRNSILLQDRNFLVEIIDDRNNIQFQPFEVKNINVKHMNNLIEITLYDKLSEETTTEEKIALLYNGNKKLTVKLHRLDQANITAHTVEYEKCKIKEYEESMLSYASNEPHTWKLNLKYKTKCITHGDSMKILEASKIMHEEKEDN